MNETLPDAQMPLTFKRRSRPLLLYILGWGRSGSSVMANILGSMSQAASLGEVRYLWDRGVLDDGICGCGATFGECAFWPGLEVAGGKLGDVSRERARALTRSIGSGGARREQIPALHSARAREAYFARNRDDLRLLMDLYRVGFATSGADVLIDASKSPFYAVNLLYPERSFDVAFLHLVRDPRAVLHSWKKTKQRKDTTENAAFPRYSSVRSLTQWAVVNSRCERFARLAEGAYFQVRYENFARNWHRTLLDQAGPLFDASPAAATADGRAAFVEAQHSISGNPSRFSLGQVRLKPDTSWSKAVTKLDRRLATLICGGVADRYGYAMRTAT